MVCVWGSLTNICAYPCCRMGALGRPCLSITLLVARAAASLARRVPVAMIAANSLVISSCTFWRASLRGSDDWAFFVLASESAAGGTELPLLSAVLAELSEAGRRESDLTGLLVVVELGVLFAGGGWATAGEGGMNCGAWGTAPDLMVVSSLWIIGTVDEEMSLKNGKMY